MSGNKLQDSYEGRIRQLTDGLMADQAREVKDFHPYARNGRFWCGGYSSDSIEGLRTIMAKLRAKP